VPLSRRAASSDALTSLDHLNKGFGTRMYKSTVGIVTLRNTGLLCLPWRGGADSIGRMLCLVILPVGACGHSVLLGVRFGSARTRMALLPRSPKLSKHAGNAWDAPAGTQGEATAKAAPRLLSSLTVGSGRCSADIRVRRKYKELQARFLCNARKVFFAF
jgi:hypothetical protein